MELLPWQVDLLVGWQTVQGTRLDRVNDFPGGALRRHEIKPPPGSEFRVIQSQDIFSNRITAAKAVEEPSINLVLLQCSLNRFNVCFVHDEIIWVRMFGR